MSTLNVVPSDEPHRQLVEKRITIRNPWQCPVDQKMLAACLSKAAQYLITDCTGIEIQVSARSPMDAPAYKHPGWLEYIIFIEYENTNGRTFELHCIQRKPHLEIEFCS